MTGLADPQVLLAAWEGAAHVPPAARAALLVHRAGLVATVDDALDLDVGACARLALRAHRDAFGDTADAVVACPGCGDLLEGRLPVPVPDDAPTGRTQRVGELVVRAPTTRDLLVAAQDPQAAADTLRGRCVRRTAGDEVDLAALSPAELDEIDTAAEDLAGVGALVGVVTCPSCRSAFDVAFDAGAVLWAQVDAAVPELLADVATLARAFGWGEAEVLSLPRSRRRAYLELAGR